jgi:hypothetical protein
VRPLAREDPDNLSVQASLALLLARSGAHAEAAPLAVSLLRMAPRYANNLYNVGCCFSLCTAAVEGGKPAQALTAQQAAQRDRYAKSALAALEEAVKQGFCNRTLLRTDPDLDAVRDRPAFAALLKKVP